MMRKKRILARPLAVLLTLTFLFTGGLPVALGAETYSGVSYWDSLLKNASYQDVSGHWAQASIYRVTALGIVRGEGGKFRPNSTASREDVLGMLIRLAGLEGQAQRINVDPDQETAHLNYWGANYVTLAQSMGIITEEERRNTNWRGAATREETAYWMARILNYLPVYGQAQQAITSLTTGNPFPKPACLTVKPLSRPR